jgi:hypothetical protein
MTPVWPVHFLPHQTRGSPSGRVCAIQPHPPISPLHHAAQLRARAVRTRLAFRLHILQRVDLRITRQTVIVIKHDVMIGTPETASGRRTVRLDKGTVAACGSTGNGRLLSGC